MTYFAEGSVLNMIPASGYVRWVEKDRDDVLSPIVALATVVAEAGLSDRTEVQPVILHDGALYPLGYVPAELGWPAETHLGTELQ